MTHYNNPFSIRVSEKIFSVDTFLDMLSAEPLTEMESLYDDDKLWDNVTYICSSPGGGKTTLLRMFSTEVMQHISLPKHKSLDIRLKKLGVKTDSEINRFAVYLLIGRDYEYIEEEFEDNSYIQAGVFFALLNTRILTAAIKSILSYTQIAYANRDSILFDPQQDQEKFEGLKFPCNLSSLMDWVCERERKICKSIGGYNWNPDSLITDSRLFAFETVTPSYFSLNGVPLTGEFIFQLDDAHKFTAKQKKWLSSMLVETRINRTIWIAERLESVSAKEVLDSNNKEGRDFNRIQLDRNDARSRRYRVMIETIAENRSRYSMTNLNLMNALRDCPYANQFDKQYSRASEKYDSEIRSITTPHIYHEWVDWLLKLPPGEEKANLCKAFLVYYNRQIKNGEALALFDLPWESCAMTLDVVVKQGIDSLVMLENGIPLYYGFSSLVDVSTHNVEQFLSFAEKMFSFLLAQRLSNENDTVLNVIDQDRILKKCAVDKYNQIASYKNGKKIMTFIENVVRFCKKETFSPTFSYRFVSGFAVQQENGIGGHAHWYEIPEYNEFVTLLRDCIAHNIIEQEVTTQGTQGQKWTVFYLSRWVCVAKGLAMNKGGWRKVNIETLDKWKEGKIK